LTYFLNKGSIGTIESWFHTANAAVLPLLLTQRDPDKFYKDLDKLTHFVLENCANNYANFLKRFKKTKKLLRKSFAVGEDIPLPTDIGPYYKAYKRLRKTSTDGLTDVQYLMCWTQTRASGRADANMMRQSVEKFISTVTTPSKEVVMNRDILYSCLGDFTKVTGKNVHISCGPAACLQGTRQSGGQTGLLKRLSTTPCLKRVYNFIDLSYEEIEPRPVRTAHDVVSWAVQEIHCKPAYCRLVRVHAIAEPSKARTITVSHYALQLLYGVLARLLTPALTCLHVTGGLKASRNLWRFLKEELDPTDTLWSELTPWSTYGVSCDLEEATDYGNMSVARQILNLAIRRCTSELGDNFPLGLAQLCKTMYLSKRYILYRKNIGWSLAIKQKGWLMGDRLTKYVLTVAHDYVLHSCGITVASIVGDDVAILTNSEDTGQKYLDALSEAGFKPSLDDFFVSKKLLFYCEEASKIPQDFDHLPATCVRRKVPSCYQDYPRIRLLIPVRSETDAYSQTNIGRFALLGKESRWVCQNNLKTWPLFKRATLLQHILVPQDKDTMCPYLPVEIGGDGAFMNDPDFLRKVIELKSRDSKEVVFRINHLMCDAWSYRFIRNERINEVIHKHHLMVPIIRETKDLIPKEALIEGDTILLSSIRVPQIETPEQTIFRLWKSYYYFTILQGKVPDEPTFKVSRSYRGGGSNPVINIPDFITRWRDEGFVFKDLPEYLVIKDKVKALDYLNLGWDLSYRETQDNPRRAIGDVMIKNHIWNDENIHSFLEHIRIDALLPQKVRDRLHRFVESDTYLMREVSKWTEAPLVTILISKDVKLAKRIASYLGTKFSVLDTQGYRDSLEVHVPTFRTWWNHTIGSNKSLFYSDLLSLTVDQTKLHGHTLPCNLWKSNNPEESFYKKKLVPLIVIAEPSIYLKGKMDELEKTLVTYQYKIEGSRTLIDYGSVNFEQFTAQDSFEDWYDEYDDSSYAIEYITLRQHPKDRRLIFANLSKDDIQDKHLVWDPAVGRWEESDKSDPARQENLS